MKKSLMLIIINTMMVMILIGCNNTSSQEIISENIIDYDKDAINEKLIVKMVEGEYYEDKEPGPYMGWKWEGKFVAELKDENDKTISSYDLNSGFSEESLIFNGKFSVEFEDYNNDGCMDFTIGQYASSNSYLYRIFSIRKDGMVTMLPADVGTEIFNDNAGYSAKFEKVDDLAFKTHCYDNEKGMRMEYLYKWINNKFEKSKIER